MSFRWTSQSPFVISDHVLMSAEEEVELTLEPFKVWHKLCFFLFTYFEIVIIYSYRTFVNWQVGTRSKPGVPRNRESWYEYPVRTHCQRPFTVLYRKYNSVMLNSQNLFCRFSALAVGQPLVEWVIPNVSYLVLTSPWYRPLCHQEALRIIIKILRSPAKTQLNPTLSWVFQYLLLRPYGSFRKSTLLSKQHARNTHGRGQWGP